MASRILADLERVLQPHLGQQQKRLLIHMLRQPLVHLEALGMELEQLQEE
ncbi:hypothetical protein MRX96_052588, partial [Rhipicephalus microplus]